MNVTDRVNSNSRLDSAKKMSPLKSSFFICNYVYQISAADYYRNFQQTDILTFRSFS